MIIKTSSAIIRIDMIQFICADFLGAMDANAPRENNSVGASHPEEFGPKISSIAVSSELEKYNYIGDNTTSLQTVLQYKIW